MNTIIVIGRLTKDVELLHTKNDEPYAKWTLAVNRTFKNSLGEYETDFIDCVAWNKIATNLELLAKKGTKIAVKGRLSTSNYETNEGETRKGVEVVVERINVI